MDISPELRARLEKITALVFDVDGVLTQGAIIYTDSGEEAKAFDVKDGLGMRVAAAGGLRVTLMTGRASSVVQRRARDLHIDEILQRVGDKAGALRTFAAHRGLDLAQIAFVGDDLNDLEAMRIAGVSIAQSMRCRRSGISPVSSPRPRAAAAAPGRRWRPCCALRGGGNRL